MNRADTRNTLFLSFLYCSCGLLVLIYVNLFPLFKIINAHFGSNFIFIAPFILPVLVATALFWVAFKRQGKSHCIKWRWVASGIGLCVIALCIPDPKFSAKRIHVAEYLLLSLLVRYTLSHRLGGIQLLLFSCLFSCLLGVHDEFLQGFHPSRTYGLKDMLVNGVAGAGGGCIWHGLQFFNGSILKDNSTAQQTVLINSLYLAWLTAAVLAMVIPISVFLYSMVPLWTVLPLAAAIVVWSCLSLLLYNGPEGSGQIYGINVVSGCSILFLCYPVLINVFKIPFY